LRIKESQLEELKRNLKVRLGDEEAKGLNEIRAELKAEKKFHSTMKNLEIKTIEADTAKLSILKDKKMLESTVKQLKQDLEVKDEEIQLMKQNFDKKFKDSSKRFEMEFDELHKKIKNLKEELESQRHYKIKYEFIEKDHKGKLANPKEFWTN
jgi:hypothetical protein